MNLQRRSSQNWQRNLKNFSCKHVIGGFHWKACLICPHAYLCICYDLKFCCHYLNGWANWVMIKIDYWVTTKSCDFFSNFSQVSFTGYNPVRGIIGHSMWVAFLVGIQICVHHVVLRLAPFVRPNPVANLEMFYVLWAKWHKNSLYSWYSISIQQ